MEKFTNTPSAGSEGTVPHEFPVPRRGEDGQPIYNQEFFVALARRGKEIWNRWRAETSKVEGQPYINVTFEGIDFSQPPNAGIDDFSGFNFGDRGNFRACRFGGLYGDGMAKFTGATFGAGTDLSGATFISANLSGAIFGNAVNLSDAKFFGTNLSGAIFGAYANLSCTKFGDFTHLSGATFGDNANLSEATFGDYADLSGAIFGHDANLSRATFTGFATLSGATFGYRANFSGATFRRSIFFDAWSENKAQPLRSSLWQQSDAMPDERKQEFLSVLQSLEKVKAGPDTFLDLKFERPQFAGKAVFSGRKLIGRLDFTQARFNLPPIFDGCEGKQNIDFYGTRIGFAGQLPRPIRRWRTRAMARLFLLLRKLRGADRPHSLGPAATAGRSPAPMLTPGWTTSSDTALRLRALRTLAEDTKNHDLERDLYIEERKAERGIRFAQYWGDGWKGRLSPRMLSHSFWIAIMFCYSVLADYGRSFVRPLVALMISVFVFNWAYGSVLIAPNDPSRPEDFHRAVWAFAISNAVPFVGALTLERDVKLTLLCGDRPFDAATARQLNVPQCVPAPGRSFQVLVLLQSIFSALCVFFIALSLRNYFKLK